MLSIPAGEIMVSHGEQAAIFTSIVCGHHVYKAVWTSQNLIAEHLTVLPETGNNHDKYAVSITKCGVTVALTLHVQQFCFGNYFHLLGEST